MRWDNLQIATAEAAGGALALALPGAVTRTFTTPGFRGVTCYEIHAKSLLSKVPAASQVPFRWTVNPYRGCTHACTYCFARNTHTYLDLDSGHDFDSRIIVKVNAADVLRRELGARSWQGEPVAMGTNTDPYQRAEGRYRLTRGILTVLRDYANPFSILTKGTLILRDLDLLSDAAQSSWVSVSLSIGFTDQLLWRQVEPGTPSPQARLGVCRTLVDAGIGCGVLMAPVLPFLTDSDEALEATVAAIAEAGASSVTPLVLHLRPGAREWYLGWLRGSRPELVPRYERLYSRGAYAPREYTTAITAKVAQLAGMYGIGARRPAEHRIPPPPAQTPSAVHEGQLTLLPNSGDLL